jgi:hypothetical protein
MKNCLRLLPFLLLAACATESPKPKQWTVNVKTQGEERLWVGKPDGSRQCAYQPTTISPDQAANQLKSAGVMVYQFKKGTDGKLRAQRCGSATGATVDVEISRRDLPRAQALGFREKASELE